MSVVNLSDILPNPSHIDELGSVPAMVCSEQPERALLRRRGGVVRHSRGIGRADAVHPERLDPRRSHSL